MQIGMLQSVPAQHAERRIEEKHQETRRTVSTGSSRILGPKKQGAKLESSRSPTTRTQTQDTTDPFMSIMMSVPVTLAANTSG